MRAEIVRRVTGWSIGTFLREEVCRPLRVDHQIGLRPEEVLRVSDMHPNPKNAFFAIANDPATPLGRAFKSAPSYGYFQNVPEIRKQEVASFGGHGNARAVARIYAMLAGNGAVDGVSLLSRETVARLAALVWEGDRTMTKRFIRMGMASPDGYRPESVVIPVPTAAPVNPRR